MGQQVGDQFSNYRLIRLLGTGGFAEVWLGKHPNEQREVAVKVLDVHLPTVEEQDNFLREAHYLGRLVHPHIVSLLDCGIQGEKPYLILDYAPNGTLRQRYRKGTMLSTSQVVQYIKQIAEGLQYAHNQRIIHRDIKPENMLLDSNDNVLLGDFGISLPGQTLPYPKTQDIMGTTGYMAPEQLDGHPALASDQYSLAIVAYEWLSGSVPFKGTPIEIRIRQRGSPPLLWKRVPGVSPAVEQVIFKALSEEVTGRFRRVQDFADALHQAVNNSNAPIHLVAQNSPLAVPISQYPSASPVQGAAVGGGNPNPYGGNIAGSNTPIPPTSLAANSPININTPTSGPVNGIPPIGGGFNNPPFNNPLNNPPPNQPQPQGPIVLPGGNATVPQHAVYGNPFIGGNPQGPNNQQTSLHSGPTVSAQPWAGGANPFGGPPSGGQATITEPKVQKSWFTDWFDRRFLKQRKNSFFVIGGGIVDFLFAAALGLWLNGGDISWDLWFVSLLAAWLFRMLCAAIKSKNVALVLVAPLVFYWYIGSWALGTILHIITNLEPIPPHIIALVFGTIGVVLHIRYVLKNKR
jgi:serine/threonine protein kinase